MFEKIKETFKKFGPVYNGVLPAILVLLVISLSINYLFYKGLKINVDRSVTQHNDQRQYQQQWQGQLLINQWTSQGNKIEWKIIYSQDRINESMSDILNKLHPISSMYAKVILNNQGFVIVYPDIFEIKLNKESK